MPIVSTSKRTKPYESYNRATTTRSAIAKRAAARRSAAIKIQSIFRGDEVRGKLNTMAWEKLNRLASSSPSLRPIINAIKTQRVKNNMKRSKSLLNKLRFDRILKHYPFYR